MASTTREFASLEDLQTTLVLRPYTEDTGQGAVVELGCDLTGWRLLGLCAQDDWSDLDFGDILGRLRSSPMPVTLYFVNDEEDTEVGESKEEEEKKDDGSPEPEAPLTAPAESSPRLPDFRSWTSRMQAASAVLADRAAKEAASLASAAKKAAEDHAAARRTVAPQSQRRIDLTLMDLFLQTSTGAFLQLDQSSTSSSHHPERQLTTASLVVARRSATEACPTRGLSFQWYRASGEQWTMLEGTTYAALQPSATEVGHCLQCRVTVHDEEEDEDVQAEPQQFVLTTLAPVAAATPIFNGARQALQRGAQFGGLRGRGRLADRSFLIGVQRTAQRKALVTIQQVSSGVAEPLHETALEGILVQSHYDNAKAFDLVVPRVDPDSMLAALLGDQRVLELSAPNRLARESLLLTMGIASYRGSLSDLTPSTILFDDTDAAGVQGTAQVLTETSDSPAEALPDIEASSSAESMGWQTPQHGDRPPLSDALHKRSRSLDTKASQQVHDELEEEVRVLRSKLERKSQAYADLRQHAEQTDQALAKTKERLDSYESALAQKEREKQEMQRAHRTAEQRNVTLNDTLQRIRGDQEAKVASDSNKIKAQEERIAELEKMVRTLQNDKALLSAAVEARESKLTRMAELQASYNGLRETVATVDSLRTKLDETKKRHQEKCAEVNEARELDKRRLGELEAAKSQAEEAHNSLEKEKGRTASLKAELDTQQMKIQKLLAERNSYKQKGDSLAKEMARVCRNGRTVREVEKILADDASRRQEVELLREQKRKALEELEHYRTAFEQSRAAQRLAGLDHDSGKLLERNAELERLLSELTEYLNAKEMQLETLKEVNDALQAEIRNLAKAHMSKNDV